MNDIALPKSTDPARSNDAPREQEAVPVGAASRIQDVDVIRGAALFGVLMMNLTEGFRVPYGVRYDPPPPADVTDRVVEHMLEVVLSGKAMTLFSLLFGVGMSIFYERAAARGPGALGLLARRLVALLAFGLAHMLLLWNGDVLAIYAVSGLIALPLIRQRPAIMLTIAVALLGGRALITWLLPTLIPMSLAGESHYRAALVAYGSGSYLDVVQFRAWEAWNFWFRFPLLDLPIVVSNFLIGATIWRVGVFRHVERHRRALFWVALLGISLGAGYAIVPLLPAGATLIPHPRGEFFRAVESVTLRAYALGYGACLLLLLQRPRARTILTRTLAPLGQMAFTNYLTQSILFSTLFYGYAFGLLTKVDLATSAVLGLAVYIAQGIFSTYWLRRFRFGPFEWAWRCLTYGKWQTMRRS